MFANMNPRERILAITVGSLLPIAVLFMAFLWFMERFDSNISEIESLEAQVEKQDEIKRLGILASQRQGYYRKVSMPKTERHTRSVYSAWLENLVVKESGLSFDGVKFKDGVSVVYERDRVARRISFTVRPKGTLPQLIKFLHEFYSADHLHRINKLLIKPVTDTKRGKTVLTDQLQMDIDIETLSLVEGPDNIEEFPVWKKELPTVDQYTQRILPRNIFGPKNNAPSLKKPTNLKFTIAKSEEAAVGKYETIQISVTDADPDNIMSFQLLEESGQDQNYGLILTEQPRSASVRKISLRVPKQAKACRIPVSVEVVDDGLPSKSDQMKFTVVFAEPKKDIPKKKPKLAKQASLTQVIGLMKNRAGAWVARIQTPTSVESLELAQGDSIKIDKVDWKVVEVTRKTVTFDAAGEQKTFGMRSLLDDPMPNP